MKKFSVLLSVLLLAACALAQQDGAPAPPPESAQAAGSQAAQDANKIEPMDQTPVFRVNVVSRTTKAVNYRHRGGSTSVDFKGTDLMPLAKAKPRLTASPDACKSMLTSPISCRQPNSVWNT